MKPSRIGWHARIVGLPGRTGLPSGGVGRSTDLDNTALRYHTFSIFRSIDRLTGGSHARDDQSHVPPHPGRRHRLPRPSLRRPGPDRGPLELRVNGGPVEHIKTGCERGHWFTPTVDSLDLEPVPARASPSLASAF